MTILYFGIYDPGYSRNRVIIRGLKENGLDVKECRVSASSRFKYLRLVLLYLKLRPKFDLMIVGFPGQEVMFLAKLITRRPVIFDAFTSHYGGYIMDRGNYGPKSFHASYYRFLDTYSCRLADIVLLDTNAHISFFVKEFNLPQNIFRRILIGADDQIFHPLRNMPESEAVFNVLFFGTYIPLQGTQFIVRAAKLLEREPTHFTMVGKGQKKKQAMDLAGELGLKNLIFKDMMTPTELREEIAKSDLCLGIFGDTPKALLVIPNKIYEAIAMAKLVITADSEAIREIFTEKDMLLVKTANSEALAEGIKKAMTNPELRAMLRENSYKKYTQYATPLVIGSELKNIIQTLHEKK